MRTGYSHKNKFLKTKIVATIGPASDNEKIIARMLQSGMRVARLNFSHGSHEYYQKLIDKLKKVAVQEDQPLALLQDLSGPKIRLSEFQKSRNLLEKIQRWMVPLWR